MKKNKKKKFFSKKRIFPKFSIIVILLFSLGGITYAIDVIGDYISTQTSTGTGTNQNKITFSNKKTTYYINKDDDDILTGDQLRGYYYDNIYGYFRLDWSQVPAENVQIISKHINSITNSDSSNCLEWYKFDGEAYSKYVGKIDFNFGNYTFDDTHIEDLFVYFCKTNNKIYGKTYSNNLGLQILDGIEINIREKQVIDKIEQKVDLEDNNNYIEDSNSIKSNYNWNNNNIGGGDKYEIENTQIGNFNKTGENVFWIIK